MTISVEIANISTETQKVSAMFAAYDENGRLSGIEYLEAELVPNERHVLEQKAFDGQDTKVFVGDSGMEPIINSVEIAPYTEPDTSWTIMNRDEENIHYSASNSLTITTDFGDIWNTG